MCVHVCGRGIRTPRGEIPMRGMLVKCGSVRGACRSAEAFTRMPMEEACGKAGVHFDFRFVCNVLQL